MLIPLTWKLCIAIVLSAAAGTVVGSWLYDNRPAPQVEVRMQTFPNRLFERRSPVVQTLTAVRMEILTSGRPRLR